MRDKVQSWLWRRGWPAPLLRRLSFEWRYLRGQTPWDGGVVPPELRALVAALPPGHALDLGSGTGTNALFLAEHGWQVVGVEWVGAACKLAQQRAAATRAAVRFLHGDVGSLGRMGVDGPFDLLLDVGCLHGLEDATRTRYAQGIRRASRAGATLLLYAARPRPHGALRGIDRAALERLLVPHWSLEEERVGEDSGGGWASAWYRWRRTDVA